MARTPPKLSATCSSVSAPRRRAASRRAQQLGTRHDRAIALSGRRFLKSSSSAMPPGIDQHDDQQQHRIEERRPRDQRRGEFRQHGQQMVPSSGPRIEPRPPIRMAMKNSTDRSIVKASGVM